MTSLWICGSFTTPFFPTNPFPASNCGLIRQTICPPSARRGSAGGKIKVTANGTGMVTALSIDPAVVDPDDAEFLQSLVLKAVQDALNGAKNMAEAEMRKVTGGLGFPM